MSDEKIDIAKLFANLAFYSDGNSSKKILDEKLQIVQTFIDRQVAEIDAFKTLGVIEIMLRNPNVDSFVKEKEKQIADLKAEVERLKNQIKTLLRIDGE